MQAISRTLIASGLVGILAFTTTASAAPGIFGSQMLAGESDWIIPAKGAGKAFTAVYAAFGTAGDVQDDCVVLRTTSAAVTVSQTLRPKDIRLTPCVDGPAGSPLADAHTVEMGATWTYDPDLHVVYVDINGNAKYDKTDYLYLTTKTVGATMTAGAADGMVATTDATAWTVRLTPAGTYPAGTFVVMGDGDLSKYGDSAQLLFAATGADNLDAGGIMEREDGQWLWIPSAAPTTLVKGIIPPLDSVRITTITPSAPAVSVVGVKMSDGDIVAGESLKLTVEFQNSGKLAGFGIAWIEVDGRMAEVRMSPLLGAGATAKALVPVTIAAPGEHTIMVNDAFKLFVQVTGEAADTADDPHIQALLERITALEARLAALEAGAATTGDAGDSLAIQQVKPAGRSPFVEPVVLLLALGLLAWRMRK